MARCISCKAEILMHENDVPICIQCSGRESPKKPPASSKEIQRLLVEDIVEATARVSAANRAFYEITSQVPSGLPHPHGSQRVHKASCELHIAREELMKAHTRLNSFVDRGIVPEDLKRRG